MVAECSQGPFVTNIVVFKAFIRNKIIVFLVDAVVCQMHELIVLAASRAVGLTGEPG